MRLRDILSKVARGELEAGRAERLLRLDHLKKIEGLATLDLGREKRKGIPEIVLCEGKKPSDVVKISKFMLKGSDRVILSRVSSKYYKVLRTNLKGDYILEFERRAGVCILRKKGYSQKSSGGKVGIITAGTADIPVAEEARIIAKEMGSRVKTAYDVGVAGVHRLLGSLTALLEDAVDVIIVVAGREGALPSVVAGLVDVPVVGLPVSSGYGFGEKGLAALMAMLQSCSLGLTVVNIDNGVGAGAIAAMIANRVAEARKG